MLRKISEDLKHEMMESSRKLDESSRKIDENSRNLEDFKQEMMESSRNLKQEIMENSRNIEEKLLQTTQDVDRKIGCLEGQVGNVIDELNEHLGDKLADMQNKVCNLKEELNEHLQIKMVEIERRMNSRFENEQRPFLNVTGNSGTPSGADISRIRMKPPQFDGKTSWSNYLRQFEAAAKANNWSTTDKATALTLALRGDATDILQTLSPAEQKDYQQLVKHLEMRYGQAHLEHVYHPQLKNRCQKSNETLQEFEADIARLVRLAYPATPTNIMERLAVQAFLDGLRDNETAIEQITCTAALQNRDLWQRFYELDTEMIITKSGRRMFPALRVQMYELDPMAHYCVLLEMVPVGQCRYKYSANNGWAPAGAEEAQSPHRVYMHPESPSTGEHWMSQPVSFGRMKLTNTPAPPGGHVVLSSMHKYQPRIIIVKTSTPRAIAWAPTKSVVFKETQFIAVTAYQNEKITKLKIDNNPFAKGFRENGQSKCKKKRPLVDEETDKEESIQETKSVSSESALSPPIDVTDEHTSSSSSSPELRLNETTNLPRSYPVPNHNYYHCNIPSYQHPCLYSYYVSGYSSYPYSPYFNNFYYPVSFLGESASNRNLIAKEKDVPPPKKLTDFSINSIIGKP